jgi:hypothetical protein
MAVLRPWFVHSSTGTLCCGRVKRTLRFHAAGRGRFAASLLNGFGLLRPDRGCRAFPQSMLVLLRVRPIHIAESQAAHWLLTEAPA